MFRLALALLLLNTSYQSFGAPTKPNTSISITNLFKNLANSCENSFLQSQIKSQISYCSDLTSILGEKELKCWMFYDINNQLCEAVDNNKLALNEDYTDKINEEQDVNLLCVGAKDWTFSNLTELPSYNQAVLKGFHQPITCGNICGVEDFMSDDVNFFCKYYKWGSDMLKTQKSIPPTSEYPLKSAALPDTGNSEVKTVSAPNNDLLDVQIKNTIKADSKPLEGVSTSVNSEAVAKTEPVKAETSSQISNIPPSNPSLLSNPEKLENSAVNNENQLVPAVNELTSKRDNKMPVGVTAPKADINLDDNKPEILEDTQNKLAEDPLKASVDKEIQLLNNELEHKEPVLENPKVKQPNDPDDYQESEEGKDGLGDTQGGDDGDDTVLEDINNKPEEKTSIKRIETIVSTYTGEKDYYANPIPDGFSGDDDHFFPFFLTAIILVVLLYVLYHNKNKVSKVFFGLILEGRQSSRRRNSRGHAYRRLDTLEQAMSANTAAPPTVASTN